MKKDVIIIKIGLNGNFHNIHLNDYQNMEIKIIVISKFFKLYHLYLGR